MNERQMAEKNKILEVVSGSFLYGTNTETSDKDYVGIFMPNVEYILGFKRCDEVDFSTISKDEKNKNTQAAVDMKLYEFRRFVKLAMENNPNILEILFVNEENRIFCNDIGKELLAIKCLFPHQGAKQRFLGYAVSQRHKMINCHGRAGNREEIVSAHGYDTKFASHLIRLMFEGVELLETGSIEFPLKERRTILDIKQGKWEMSKVLDFSSELEKQIESIDSKLPAKPNVEALERFTINKLRNFMHNI